MKKFKIILSSKTEILIDEDELDSVLKAINVGAISKVRQGIFNPAFFIAIVPAKEYMEQYRLDHKYEIRDKTAPALPPVLENVFNKTVAKLTTGKK